MREHQHDRAGLFDMRRAAHFFDFVADFRHVGPAVRAAVRDEALLAGEVEAEAGVLGQDILLSADDGVVGGAVEVGLDHVAPAFERFEFAERHLAWRDVLRHGERLAVAEGVGAFLHSAASGFHKQREGPCDVAIAAVLRGFREHCVHSVVELRHRLEVVVAGRLGRNHVREAGFDDVFRGELAFRVESKDLV